MKCKKLGLTLYSIEFEDGQVLQYIDAFQLEFEYILDHVVTFHGMDQEKIKKVTVTYDFTF